VVDQSFSERRSRISAIVGDLTDDLSQIG